jgi:hypothetical protein
MATAGGGRRGRRAAGVDDLAVWFAGIAAAALAAGPVLAVALPAWLLWRLATGRLAPAAGRWLTLAVLAGLVAAGHVWAASRGTVLLAPVVEYLGVQAELGRYLLAGAIAAVGGRPNPYGPWDVIGPRYLAVAGPLVALLGVPLALGWDAWRRWSRPLLGRAPVAHEEHATGLLPVFPARVEARAEAGLVEHKAPCQVGSLPLGSRRVDGHPVDGAMLAWTPNGEPVCLYGPEYDFHAFVAGTTRMGKSNLLLHRLHPCLTRPDRAALVIDLKGDADLARDGEAAGMLVWTMAGARRWNPLTGTPAQVAEKLVETAGTVTGDQQNFRNLGYCQALVEAVDAAGQPRELRTAHGLLRPKALRAYLANAVAPRDRELAAELAGRIEDADEDGLAALGGRLHPLAYGDAKDALGAGPDAIDLERELGAGRVVLLSIPALENKREAAKLGAWALIEAGRVTSALHKAGWKSRGNRGLIAVDEFSALGRQGERAINLLQRSGGFGWQVWLLTQGISDLNDAMDKTAARRVLNATQINLIFRHEEPADAETWASYLGSYRTQTFRRPLDGETAAPTGNWTAHEETRPYVPAGVIEKLPRGVCYAKLPGLSRPVALRVPRAIPERLASGTGPPPGRWGDGMGRPPGRGGGRPAPPTPAAPSTLVPTTTIGATIGATIDPVTLVDATSADWRRGRQLPPDPSAADASADPAPAPIGPPTVRPSRRTARTARPKLILLRPSAPDADPLDPFDALDPADPDAPSTAPPSPPAPPTPRKRRPGGRRRVLPEADRP